MLGWPGLASGGIEAYPYSFVTSVAGAEAGAGEIPRETGLPTTGRLEPHGHAVCDGPSTPQSGRCVRRDADWAAAVRLGDAAGQHPVGSVPDGECHAGQGRGGVRKVSHGTT